MSVDRQAADHERTAVDNLRDLAAGGVTPTSLQGCQALARIILDELGVPAIALPEHGLTGWQGTLVRDVLTQATDEQQEAAFNRRSEIRKSRQGPDDCFKGAAAGELLGLSDEDRFVQLRTYLENRHAAWRWAELIEKDDNQGERNHRRLRASLWLAAASAKTGERREEECLLALLSAVKVYVASPEVQERLDSRYARYWTVQPAPVQPPPSETPPLVPPPAVSPLPLAQSSAWSKARIAVVAVVLVLLAGGSVFVGKLLAESASSNTGSETPGQTDASSILPVSTEYEVAYTGGIGAYTNAGPSRRSVPGAALPEGEDLSIVCQERNGEVLKAEEFADGDESPRYDKDWGVWNKLDNDYWIPDLFVNTPKVPGDDPPEGIALCED